MTEFEKIVLAKLDHMAEFEKSVLAKLEDMDARQSTSENKLSAVLVKLEDMDARQSASENKLSAVLVKLKDMDNRLSAVEKLQKTTVQRIDHLQHEVKRIRLDLYNKMEQLEDRFKHMELDFKVLETNIDIKSQAGLEAYAMCREQYDRIKPRLDELEKNDTRHDIRLASLVSEEPAKYL